MSEKQGQKRKKSYYVDNKKSNWKSQSQLCPKQKGFLLTCNNMQDKQCKAEAYRILNEYADILYGPEKSVNDGETEDKNDDDNDDLDAALQREIKRAKTSKQRFQALNCGAKNCVFIKTDLPRPDELATKIFADVLSKREAKSRFIQRFLPITHVCKIHDEDIAKCAVEMVGEFKAANRRDADETFEYCVMFRQRCNGNVARTTFYQHIEDALNANGVNFLVKFEKPKFVVIIEVIKTICCMSIVEDYFEFNKYNIAGLIKPDEQPRRNEKQEGQRNEGENEEGRQRIDGESKGGEIDENEEVKSNNVNGTDNDESVSDIV
ncbi:THUMP domain-containing protein 1-like [Tubulanus polymorphus]|uniref:THUMP domain-containing protein 1-like n=1 Tax=Tubulanus polymorphus TaxID=672921 RepID=UPI003DA366E1